MSKLEELAPVVEFKVDGVHIRQQSHLILCASLFYFRIPRAYWKERMQQLVALGYNCIDVYFPWNYHEQSEGDWYFEGEHDVSAFLAAAAESGLWVIARPGPYICSEWDGGGLPAYLLVKDGIRLRDNDSQFLNYVGSWFDRIMPLLRNYQEGEGGSIIGIQLDNELDFYNCYDPAGYIGALRDMTLAHGITVPLFACAGQGGLEEATGWAAGVVPACNVYVDDRAPELEAKVLHYEGIVRKRGHPLLVTETNRSHYFLRRLLACGAKLLGPYLQVSGTDFGFTNATNNWGQPLAFMTSDYDFGGMISPEGEIRKEGYEGRLLSRLIRTYGEALSRAQVCDFAQAGLELGGDISGIAQPQLLRLKGGGYLLFLTNLEDRPKRLVLRKEGEFEESYHLSAGRSLALPLGVPLPSFGARGILVMAAAELYLSALRDNGATLVFHAEEKATLLLRVEQPKQWEGLGVAVIYRNGMLVIETEGTAEASCRILFADGNQLQLIIHSLDKALHLSYLEKNNELVVEQSPNAVPSSVPVTSEWRMTAIEAGRPIPGAAGPIRQAKPDYLEKAGIYRGYAWYETHSSLPSRAIKGILIRRGSDVVSLYADGEYVGTSIPGGSSSYMPLQEPATIGQLQARVEIWGHSNFDDVLQPALGLHSMRGLQGMIAISEVHRLSGNWHLNRSPYRGSLTVPLDAGNADTWPLVGFGDWTSPDQPALECYRRTFTPAGDANSWTLHFPELQVSARLYIDGHDLGEISPFDPYVELTAFLIPGRTVELTVAMERARGLARGQVILYEGVETTDCSISAAGEAEWLQHATSCLPQASSISLPLVLDPGQAAWLFTETAESQRGHGWRVAVEGSALKLTAFFAGRIVGRLWLNEGSKGPTMRGGDPVSFYLPGAWYNAQAAGQLSLLLEAVDKDAPGRLVSVRFQDV
ncbi:beta-galactosidase [Paenibacillus daejeonensis]|uniref:beta-galactosidase n=1 Tax=Paenibacillus daejeonensis TaxID=135193 RepID=UPI00036107D4|nr:beta-galactosidase [Paenibacillus daejeonensis]